MKIISVFYLVCRKKNINLGAKRECGSKIKIISEITISEFLWKYVFLLTVGGQRR